MKIREKSKICLNCHTELRDDDNFCSSCGQENDQKNKKLTSFVRDFFDDLFSIDSRLWRSIPVFLFKPAKLTQEYNEGKRKKYITPIRLYLTMSIFYFFVMTFLLSLETEKIDKKPKDSNKPKTLNIFGIKIDTDKASKLLSKKDKTEEKLTQKQILDSLGLENTYFNYIIVKQSAKLNNASLSEISNYFLGKIPFVMFFMLPLFALLLHIFYVFSAKKYFYVSHLIFTLHIHAFAFVVLTFVLFCNKYIQLVYFEDFYTLGILWIAIYFFIALKRIYNQNYILTFIKFILISILYSIMLLFGIIFGILISFLFF